MILEIFILTNSRKAICSNFLIYNIVAVWLATTTSIGIELTAVKSSLWKYCVRASTQFLQKNSDSIHRTHLINNTKHNE